MHYHLHFFHYHVNSVIDYLRTYGYGFVFIGTIFEGEVVLLAAGFFSFLKVLNFWYVASLGFVGAIIGDNVWFFVGKKYGKASIEKHGKLLFLGKSKVEKMKAYFARHGSKTIFFSRFVFGTRITSSLLAGALHMKTKEFQRANILGAALWAFVVVSAGYLFGNSYELLRQSIHRTEKVLLILALIVIIILLLRKLLERLDLNN